jgi:hypothetical protein
MRMKSIDTFSSILIMKMGKGGLDESSPYG